MPLPRRREAKNLLTDRDIYRGQLVRDKKTGEPKHIRCRNWECGVVYPVPNPQTLGGGSAVHEHSHRAIGMEIFHGHVPVPMTVPAEGYEGKEPWFFNSV